MPKNTIVIVPAYNESPKIGEILNNLLENQYLQIVVIDDGSIDNTSKEVSRYPVVLIKHPINLGKGAALKTGFQYALQSGFQYVVTCDADGQHLARDVFVIVEKLWQNQEDVVLGSRFLRAQDERVIPLMRIFYNKIANVITWFFEGIKVTDSQCGLRGYKIQAIKTMNLQTRGLEIDSEILGEMKRNKLRFIEVPITPVYSKYSLAKGQSLLKGIETLYSLLIKEL